MTLKTTITPYTLIAGLTRNLPYDMGSTPRMGDGGCFSAMRVKGWM